MHVCVCVCVRQGTSPWVGGHPRSRVGATPAGYGEWAPLRGLGAPPAGKVGASTRGSQVVGCIPTGPKLWAAPPRVPGCGLHPRCTPAGLRDIGCTRVGWGGPEDRNRIGLGWGGPEVRNRIGLGWGGPEVRVDYCPSTSDICVGVGGPPPRRVAPPPLWIGVPAPPPCGVGWGWVVPRFMGWGWRCLCALSERISK